MGAADYLLLALIGAVFLLALRHSLRHRGGGCGGDCSQCRGCTREENDRDTKSF